MDQVENSGNEIVHINEWAVGHSAVWLLTRSMSHFTRRSSSCPLALKTTQEEAG